MPTIAEDPRIDPRLKAMFGDLPAISQLDVSSREELIERMNRPEAIRAREAALAALNTPELEQIAPSDGLDISSETITSQPDGNAIKVLLIRPNPTPRCPPSITSTAAACSPAPATTHAAAPGDG